MFDDYFFSEEISFLNPKNTNQDKCNIYFDTAERTIIPEVSEILHNEFKRTNLWSEIEKDKDVILEVGDILIVSPDKTQEIVLERKTVKDLVSSMKDSRSENQIPKLADCENGFLIIIGNVFDKEAWKNTNMAVPDSVTRYISGLTAKTNTNGNRVELIQILDTRQFAVQIDYFAKLLEKNELFRDKEKKFKKASFGRGKIDYKNPEVINDTRLAQLSQIGKVNIKTARKILDYFKGDYKKIQNASILELTQIDDIGEILAERIRNVYN